MERITFRADEELLAAANERAAAEGSSLGDEFRRWLRSYAGVDDRIDRYEEAMNGLRGRVRIGERLTRDAMNER